ncbi:MAG: MFS transporter [Kineosporiaceae bacterium]
MVTPAPGPPSTPARETFLGLLRRRPSFRYLWFARAVSGLGSAISSVVLPVLTYRLTGEPLLVSLVVASGTLPYLVLGLPAGAWADPRRSPPTDDHR